MISMKSLEGSHVFKRNEIYMQYYVSFFSVVLTPFVAIYLFQKGWWMSICYILYFVVLCFYISIVIKIFEIPMHSKLDKSTTAIDSFVATMNFTVAIMSLFPAYMYFSDFVDRYNYVFGTNFYITYEGGIITFFILSIIILFFLCLLIQSIIILSNLASNNRKQTVKGISIACMLIVIPAGAVCYKLQSYTEMTPAKRWNFYMTQQEYEDEKFSKEYERWRDAQIYKAVKEIKEMEN